MTTSSIHSDTGVEVIDEADQRVLIFATDADADAYGLTGDDTLVIGEAPLHA